MARLVGIGLVAGVFSSLFGVGGGIVIVPLLIWLRAFEPHRATATSLAAILITATAGFVLYALHGHVHPGYAVLVGVPAVAGAYVGAGLQQRLSGRSLTVGFALFLCAVAIWLVVS
ncbi:MAG: sulfite exporter TauE/SafE family protein [Gaiellales bacterium]